jgi:hypothetical protein
LRFPAEGAAIPYNPRAKTDALGTLNTLYHHAEMKVLHWAKANGYDVVAMAPTRGCCPNCQNALRTTLGEKGFNAVVPESRRSAEAFSEHLKFELTSSRATEPASASAAEGPHGARTKAGGALLDAKALGKAGKLLSHFGAATTALDVFQTSARVGEKLQSGEHREAARLTLEFGGRTWGAAEGSALGAEIGAVAGSIVPGAGTLVGAAAGGVIGGVVGAAYGEHAAAQLFSALQRFGDGKLGKAAAQRGAGTGAARDHDGEGKEGKALQHFVYEKTFAKASEQAREIQAAHPGVAPAGVLDRMAAQGAEVLGPLSHAFTEPLKRYRSDAVVRELDKGKQAARQRTHDPLPGRRRDPGTASDRRGALDPQTVHDRHDGDLTRRD